MNRPQSPQGKSEAELEKDRVSQLMLDTFSTEAGQECLEWLSLRFGLLERSFKEGGNGAVDTERGLIRDGERGVIIEIIKGMKHARDAKRGGHRITLPIL